MTAGNMRNRCDPDLPEGVYFAAQARALDAAAMEQDISGATLMQRAGAAAFALLRERWPRARRITVVCGAGNNGGDGYVIARLAQAAGLTPLVLSVGDGDTVRGDALAMRQALVQAGVTPQPFSSASRPRREVMESLRSSDVIIDAIFGIGLTRPVDGVWRQAIEAINECRKPVLAIDVPSGLHADSGSVLGAAVRADVTLSFIALKAGLFTGQGREYSGDIRFDDLGAPPEIYAKLPPPVTRLTPAAVQRLLPRRRRDAHKGDAGRVLAIGGAPGMSGAVRMAGEAAYRVGAGLVILALHPVHAGDIAVARPELIAFGLYGPEQLVAAAARAQVLALGCGLGQSEWARSLWEQALALNLPVVVDADGLNLLAANPRKRDDWVLTPHPGEAARLLQCDVAAVQANRFAAARAVADRYGGVCVLKGAGTLIARSQGAIALCDRGNPGMASAGMGDVLAGAIAGLYAQGVSAWDAACAGVWLHAAAGDAAARAGGEIGLLATDLMDYLRRYRNDVCDGV